MNIPSDMPTIDRLIECLKPSNSGPGRMDRARDLVIVLKKEREEELYRRSWRGRWDQFTIKWVGMGKKTKENPSNLIPTYQWERLWADRGKR